MKEPTKEQVRVSVFFTLDRKEYGEYIIFDKNKFEEKELKEVILQAMKDLSLNVSSKI